MNTFTRHITPIGAGVLAVQVLAADVLPAGLSADPALHATATSVASGLLFTLCWNAARVLKHRGLRITIELPGQGHDRNL